MANREQIEIEDLDNECYLELDGTVYIVEDGKREPLDGEVVLLALSALIEQAAKTYCHKELEENEKV